MAVMEAPHVLEAEASEDLGYFFKRLGELCLSPASAQAFPGPASSLAVAARSGAVFFSDAQGVYACQTSTLLPRLQKWGNSDEEMPVTQPTEVAAAVLPLPSAALLALSPDDALLAVCSGTTLQVYSTQSLMAGSSTASIELALPQSVVQLAWRPGAAAECAALLVDRSIQLLDLASGAAPAVLAAAAGLPAACIAWSLDGSLLAVGAAKQVVLYVAGPAGVVGGWRQAAAVRALSNEVQDDDQELQVDSVAWVGQAALLVSSKLLSGGVEEAYAPLCMLTWQGSVPSESNLELSEFFANNILEDAAVRGPWLRTATVPQWETAVYAHRKASDSHVKLAVLVGGRPVAADVTDDRLAIRIPNAPEGDDNFVVGLGIVLSCMEVVVQHPTDDTAPDLPPQPVLLVATSDGVLRFYTFGRIATASFPAGPCIVAPPQLLPSPPPLAAAAMAPHAAAVSAAANAFAAAAAQPVAPSSAEQRAAGTALPDEDSDFEQEQEEQEEEGESEGGAAAEARAAATALPESDFEDEEEEEEEEQEEAGTPTSAAPLAAATAPKIGFGMSSAPAPGADKGSAAAKPLFSFASGTASGASLFGAAAAAGSAPPLSFGGHSAPAFGLSGGSTAAVPAFGGLSFGAATSSGGSNSSSAAAAPAFGFGAPASNATGSSCSLFGGMNAAAKPPPPPPVALSHPPKPKAAASQPPMPSFAQAAESQKLLAKVQPAASGFQAPQTLATEAQQPTKEPASLRQTAQAGPPAPPAPPPKTAVEAPAPKLAGEAQEAAALEADFLRSLHQTRQLEADMHDMLAAVIKGSGTTHSAAAFGKLQQRTQKLQAAAAAAVQRLERQRQQLAEVAAAAKDALRKCDAMPAFGPGGEAAGGAQQLLQRQPLEPALGALRDDIRSQLQLLRLTADDLQECLMAMEERQRQLRSDAAPPRLTTQHIYNTVNSQMAIIQTQAVRLRELTSRLEARGLLEDVDLEVDLDELAEEEELGGLGLGRKLTRLVLTPGSAVKGGISGSGGNMRRGGPRSSLSPHDSTGRQRSPWRLVVESPVLQPRGQQTPGSQQQQQQRQRSPLGAAASPGAATGGNGGAAVAQHWRQLQHQLLQRCQAEGGGVRLTTAKKRASALAPASPAPPAPQLPASPAPLPPPEIPPFSLASTSTRAPPAASKPPQSGTSLQGGLMRAGSSSFGVASIPAPPPTSTSTSSAASGAPGQPFFLPAASFEGARPGYVFKLDGSGLGYYRDSPLPTAGSLFGKPSQAAPKPKGAASQPPMPSFAQAAESQKLLAKAGIAAKPAPAAAAKPQPPSSQPPMPSLAQAAESQKLLAKVQPAASGGQPPMPSAVAAQAAQQRLSAFLSSSSAAESATSSTVATAAAASAPSFGFGASSASAPSSFGFGASSAVGSPFNAAPAAPAATPAVASSAAGSEAAAVASFASFGFGGASSAAAESPAAPAAPPFGTGSAFGASSAPAAAAPFGFGAAPAAASTPASPFGVSASSPATSSFGASISNSATSSFGASISSPAASPFGGSTGAAASNAFASFGAAPTAASAPAASSPFGGGEGFGAAAQSAAPANPFSAFGAAAGNPSTGSAFGQPASPSPPFSTPAKPAGSVFGAPATPGFGQAASGFGAVASQPTSFGTPNSGGFGAAASQSAFGQPSAFSAAAAAAQPTAGFGALAQPGGAFGGFGQSAGQAPFGQSPGFAAAAQQGGGFAAFGQQQPAPSQGGSPFGGFGQPVAGGGFGGFGGSSAATPPKPSGGAAWQPRK